MSEAPTRVALVTGCGKRDGIGRAVANVLAASCAVVVTDVQAAGVKNANEADAAAGWRGLDSVVEEIEALDGAAAGVVGDVSDADDCAAMVAAATERYGRLDVLVNNAGAPQGEDFGELDAIPLAAWDRMMRINVDGVFFMCRAAVPVMRRQRWGRIVNIASIAGLVGRPRSAAYSASKAAVLGFTKSLAIDLAPYRVTVNAINPGSVRTSRAYAAARRGGATDVDAVLGQRVAQIPVGRYGEAADIAAAAAFLASDAAGYITGHGLTVDGGEVRA
jgi:NAD(P)-dependent dehydrogenase (short-subunit alcohol dehydrogenase family)